MEFVTIDKLNNEVIYSEMDIFLSKKIKKYKITELESITMVYKGHERISNDTRRYYIELKFTNEEIFLFGECSSYRKISEKYQKCIALFFNRVIAEVDKGLLVDLTTSAEKKDRKNKVI